MGTKIEAYRHFNLKASSYFLHNYVTQCSILRI